MKFTVLLPTRNRIEYLRYAVESVRRQDYDDWEIVISDNFSDDDIAGYAESLGDSRVRYTRTESMIPVTANWNNALSLATGDYVLMLGDDDGLVPGCFQSLRNLIGSFENSDLVFFNAYQFAYPGVVPEYPRGYLMQSPRVGFFQGLAAPRVLERPEALAVVRQSMRLQLPVSYNMQHLLVSRGLVNRMQQHGPFYQSPYPDYYAANALLLLADKPVISPELLTIIGISPKSFGNFLINDDELKGVEFLHNQSDVPAQLKDVVLPGLTHNTSWLAAMETLQQNLGRDYSLSVSYERYRWIQIAYVCERLLCSKPKSTELFDQLWGRLNGRERALVAAMFRLPLPVYRQLPESLRLVPVKVLRRWLRQYPIVRLDRQQTPATNLLEVFEQLSPARQRTPAAVN